MPIEFPVTPDGEHARRLHEEHQYRISQQQEAWSFLQGGNNPIDRTALDAVLPPNPPTPVSTSQATGFASGGYTGNIYNANRTIYHQDHFAYEVQNDEWRRRNVERQYRAAAERDLEQDQIVKYQTHGISLTDSVNQARDDRYSWPLQLVEIIEKRVSELGQGKIQVRFEKLRVHEDDRFSVTLFVHGDMKDNAIGSFNGVIATERSFDTLLNRIYRGCVLLSS